MDFCLIDWLLWMLFVQHLLLPCHYNTVSFLQPFIPTFCDRVVRVSSRQPLAPRAGRRLRPCQWDDSTDSAIGSGSPNESQPRNICWHYWERETFLPTGVTGRMWTCSLPPWRESLPEKEGNKEEKLARVSESFLIPSSEHLHQVVPEDKLDFSITSVNNFPLVCMTSVSDTCN